MYKQWQNGMYAGALSFKMANLLFSWGCVNAKCGGG